MAHHTLCSSDGAEPGHTTANNEDFCRWDSTGGRDLAGEESSEMIGRLDNRLITGYVGHRTQRIVNL